jgi:hypothetical protein
MGLPLQVAIDCADPEKLSAFWAEAIHYKLQDPPTGYQSWEAFLEAQGVPQDQWNNASAIVDPEGQGPRIFFQRVPEPKITKNRVHLDVNVIRPEASPEEREQQLNAEVERLKHLGARELYRAEEFGSRWVTMADPEDNEFCVQ